LTTTRDGFPGVRAVQSWIGRLVPFDGATWLDQAGRLLLLILPVTFLLGRAPSDIALSLIACLFLLRSALTGEWAWLRTPWVIVALVIWAYLLAITPFGLNAANSFERAAPFGRFVLFAAALQHWLLTDRIMQRRLLMIVGAVVGFVAIDTLVQFWLGRDLVGNEPWAPFRLNGPFDRNVPGTFLTKTSLPLVGLCFAWALLRGRPSILLAMAVAVVLCMTIALTGERMALLTFGLGLLLFLIALPRLRWAMAAVGLLCVTLLSGTIATNAAIGERLIDHTIKDVDNFFADRYGIIVIKGLSVWQSSPWIGVGLKNFRLDCSTGTYKPRGPVEEWCFMHPHNTYMEWLVETGAIGLAGFLLLIVLWGRETLAGLQPRAPDFPLKIGAVIALVMFLWPFMSGMSFFTNWNAVLFWLMLGIALALCAPRPLPGAAPARPA
jgi:O-antigen ligase